LSYDPVLSSKRQLLTRLPMSAMYATARTELTQFQPGRVVATILLGGVVPLAADLTFEGDDHAGGSHALLQDLGDHAGADGLAAFADGEAQTLFQGDRGDERDGERGVVAGHDHLGPRRQLG